MFNKLLKLREEQELSQQELGKIVNVDRSVIAKWENKSIAIPLKHLNTISNYFNVNIDYILALTNKKTNIKKIKELNKKEIGQRIKIVRKENNLTLRSLAKELNTTSSTISAYETGKTLILTAFAYQIARKYKISLDWLLGKSTNKYL